MAKRKSVALVRAEKALASAKARANRLSKRYNKPPMAKIAVQVGGGALAGAVRVYSPVQNVYGLPIDSIGGVALIMGGTFTKGKQAELMLDLGAGMLASSASRFTEDMLK